MSRNPLAVRLGRAAEENEIEVVEAFLRDRCDNRGFIADVSQRSSRVPARIEQRDFRERKGALAEDGLDLVADQRYGVDDAKAVAGGGLGVGHCAAGFTTGSKAQRLRGVGGGRRTLSL